LKTQLSETDILLYYLGVEKKYYALLELYGLIRSHSVCPNCGKNTNLHFRLVKDIIDDFGLVGKIDIPSDEEIKQVTRDIAIWKGLTRCQNMHQSLRAEEYADRFDLHIDFVYRIKRKVQAMIDRFLTMKQLFHKKENGLDQADSEQVCD
jgi:hypothetical protein